MFGKITAPALLIAFLSGGCTTQNVEVTRGDQDVLSFQGQDPIPARLMQDLQADLSLAPFQAAAVVGNLGQETGNFRYLQQVNGPSYGYSQWLGSRKSAFFNFAPAHGGPTTYDANYAFLLHELTGPYLADLKRLRQAGSLEAATAGFMKGFLRPHKDHANLPRRVKYARTYLSGAFDGAGCADPGYVSSHKIRPCGDSSRQASTGDLIGLKVGSGESGW